MSKSASPYPGSGSASPLSISHTTQSSVPSSKPSSSRSTPKPTNVFTNDGSFLERIQRSKKEEEDKKKEQELLERKKRFDNRFRNRGKHSAPDPVPSSDTTSSSDIPPAKKLKPEERVSDYQNQVNNYASRMGMKDTGTGIRPLVK